MIPINNYLVPLLHTLIGIGNDVFDNFRDIINEEIECLDPKEISTRQAAVKCTTKIEKDVQEREAWDASQSGREYSSLKGKIYRMKLALKKLGDLSSASQSLAVDKRDGIEKLLDELDEYVDVDGDGSDGGSELMNESVITDTASVPSSPLQGGPSTSAFLTTAREKQEQLIEKCKEAEGVLKPLEAQRKIISDKVIKGRSLLTRLNKQLGEFRSVRKRSQDGVENKLLSVLKSIGVELTRYHGGSLAGMDIKRVVANASHIFDEFAIILKQNRRDDCKLSEDDIQSICNDHKHCLHLWDDAFSLARNINPTKKDCLLYDAYVHAAVVCHTRLGMSTTHKVHLMLCHVKEQMERIPGGLGHKMEDWVELMHQVGTRARIRFRNVKDLSARAAARSKAEHRSTLPEVLAAISKVKEENGRQFKTPIVRMEDKRRSAREKDRFNALTTYYVQSAAATRIHVFMKKSCAHSSSSVDVVAATG